MNNKNTVAEFKSKIQPPHTTMDALRDVLKTLETRISKLKEISAEDAQEIPMLFDQMEILLTQLKDKDFDLSSEIGIADMVSARFRKSLALFVQKAGGPNAIKHARLQRQPTQDYWWWFADEITAIDQKEKFTRRARNLGIITILLIIVVIVYQNFFAPDPNFQAMYGHQQQAENMLMNGDFEGAIIETKAALTYVPDEPELLILLGTLQNAQGQSDLAEENFQTAFKYYQDQEDSFYIQRALFYMMMNATELSLADSETAVGINPDSANGFLLMGQVYEAMGDNNAAIDNYEKADAAALRSGDAQLQVIARVNLSNALQRISLPTLDLPESGEGQ